MNPATGFGVPLPFDSAPFVGLRSVAAQSRVLRLDQHVLTEGCPWRGILRLAGGDLNALTGLVGLGCHRQQVFFRDTGGWRGASAHQRDFDVASVIGRLESGSARNDIYVTH